MPAAALSCPIWAACDQPVPGELNALFRLLATVATRSVPAVLAAGSVSVTEAVVVLTTGPICTLATGAVVRAPAGRRTPSWAATAAARSTTAPSVRPSVPGDIGRPYPYAGSFKASLAVDGHLRTALGGQHRLARWRTAVAPPAPRTATSTTTIHIGNPPPECLAGAGAGAGVTTPGDGTPASAVPRWALTVRTPAAPVGLAEPGVAETEME